MTPVARIQAAITLLAAIEDTPRPADSVISKELRARRYIGSKDRHDIVQRLYSLLRARLRLGWWLDKLKITQTPRTLMIAWLMLGEGRSADQTAGSFSGGMYAPDAPNAEEKKLLRALEGRTLEHPEMPEDVKVECPAWASDALHRALGKDFAREMAAMLNEATLDLRANIVKTTRDDLIAALKKDGIEAGATALSPWGVRLEKRAPLAGHKLFKDGAFDIQDEGSQMIGLIAGALPGKKICDFCAGAGGKTLAIGAVKNNRGRIIACDVLGGRLKRAKDRFKRAGLHNIEVRELTSERDKWVKRNKGKFNTVLVDAPCSGTGTWRRNPDARWQQLGPGLEELVPLQASILDSAARLVAAGGHLVYSTCSLLPEENEAQIDKFLESHEEFEKVPLEDVLEQPPCPGPYMRLTPAQHGTDGFFAAILKRKAA